MEGRTMSEHGIHDHGGISWDITNRQLAGYSPDTGSIWIDCVCGECHTVEFSGADHPDSAIFVETSHPCFDDLWLAEMIAETIEDENDVDPPEHDAVAYGAAEWLERHGRVL
jgi:hypothetical protein